jgi:hypothetical protein
VDDLAARLLIKVLDDPHGAPNPRTNPFSPMGQNESGGQFNPYLMRMSQFNPMSSMMQSQ